MTDAKLFAKDVLDLSSSRSRAFAQKITPGTLAAPWFAADNESPTPRWEIGTWDSGKGGTLDLHPSVPAWDDIPIIVEYGILAADRTLTLLLLAEGHTHDVLAQTEDADRVLRRMLRAIPVERRVVIVALGLGAWLDAPWQALAPSGRTFWLADTEVGSDSGWQRIYRIWTLLSRADADVMLAPTFAADLDAALDAAATRFPDRPRFDWWSSQNSAPPSV